MQKRSNYSKNSCFFGSKKANFGVKNGVKMTPKIRDFSWFSEVRAWVLIFKILQKWPRQTMRGGTGFVEIFIENNGPFFGPRSERGYWKSKKKGHFCPRSERGYCFAFLHEIFWGPPFLTPFLEEKWGC